MVGKQAALGHEPQTTLFKGLKGEMMRDETLQEPSQLGPHCYEPSIIQQTMKATSESNTGCVS